MADSYEWRLRYERTEWRLGTFRHRSPPALLREALDIDKISDGIVLLPVHLDISTLYLWEWCSRRYYGL